MLILTLIGGGSRRILEEPRGGQRRRLIPSVGGPAQSCCAYNCSGWGIPVVNSVRSSTSDGQRGYPGAVSSRDSTEILQDVVGSGEACPPTARRHRKVDNGRRENCLSAPVTDSTYSFSTRCTIVQSAVLRSHVVCLCVCL